MASKKSVKIGNLTLGGGAPVAVQSMLSTRAEDTEACVKQAKALEGKGYVFSPWTAEKDGGAVYRICTGWATLPENVTRLVSDIESL